MSDTQKPNGKPSSALDRIRAWMRANRSDLIVFFDLPADADAVTFVRVNKEDSADEIADRLEQLHSAEKTEEETDR